MIRSLFLLTSTTVLLSSCGNKSNDDVVSTRRIHKWGYDISPQDWEEKRLPGLIETTFRNGKTTVETYEDKLLHGDKTISFEHSKTVQLREEYNKGTLVKRTTYSISGVPEQETLFKSPTHHIVKTWYSSGSPKSTEEFSDLRLINGEYYSVNNETDSHITNGSGEKTISNQFGDILEKQVYVNYEIAYIETYHQNGTPHVITSYRDGKMHGEKKVFSPSADPISVENYAYGLKTGICSYYQNGYVFQKTTYAEGRKHGIEQFFIDGETISEETMYLSGLKHGPSIVFCHGSTSTQWFFSDEKVSKEKFDQYEERDMMISSLQN